jgi:hypothetical protein
VILELFQASQQTAFFPRIAPLGGLWLWSLPYTRQLFPSNVELLSVSV